MEIGVNESSIHALLPALALYRAKYPKIHVRIHRVFSRDVPGEILNYRHGFWRGDVPADWTRILIAVEFLRDDLAFVVPPRPPAGQTANGERERPRRRNRSSRTSWNRRTACA